MANAIMTAKSTFGDGLVMDLAPDNTQATCLSNALNATLVTMNGNELSLQNDMGNGRVETAYLPEGYVPVGTCEFGDIIYIVSYNPLTNKSQIGCFPSPERNISSEEMGDKKQTLSTSDFMKNGEIVTNSVKKILCSKDLNPGDKFIVYSNNLGDSNSPEYSNTVITDYGNTSETLYTFPKEIRISLVAIEDSGKINYLDSTLKWYGSGNNTYYINKSANNVNKPDLDSYRNLLNSGYSVFQSKVSGKLAILAELERIDSFNCTYSVYKTNESVTGSIEYINYSIYLNCNWKTSNNDVNPIKMQIFNADWVGNQIKNQDGKIEKKGGTYPLLKIKTKKEEENTDVGRVNLPGDLKKVKYINFTFPNNYIRQDKRSSYEQFINHNYDFYTKDLSIHKLTQAINKGVPNVGHYYIDLAQIVDNKYYNSELKPLEPTEISDMIVNNFYKGSVYKQLADIQIPNIQRLEVDGEVQRFNIDKKDLIIKFDVAPVMTYGALKDLTNTLYIDFSKVGTGTIELKGYKYYIGSNLCTLSLGTEIYPEENKGVSEILLEFYDNQGLCATYHINDRESYSGNITEYIPLNGESTNYKLSALKDDGTPILHAGIKDINGSIVLNSDGKPEQKSQSKVGEKEVDTYQNDAGILYSNMLYAVKITIKYRSKNVLGEYESSNTNDKSEWRWLWTNTMFNDYYYTVKDFKDNQFTLDLDITANYYPEYKTNQRVIYENSIKNLDGNNINKGLGTSIQNLNGDIKYQIDLGLQNNYSMFSLNGSQNTGVFYQGNSTINIYLGDNYISYSDKKLKQLTTDNYDISAIEPSYQKYDSELTKKYEKLINNETIANWHGIWENPKSYKDTIQVSFDKTGKPMNKIEYLGYDQEVHTTTTGINPTLERIHTSSDTKGSLKIDLWTFNKYLKLYQSTKTEAPVIQSLLLADNNRWGLNFVDKNTVQFANIYTFSTITLGDDKKDDGSVVTLVDKWKNGTTISKIKDLMFDRVFYRRRTGGYEEKPLNDHKEYAQVRLAYNRKDDGNTNFSPYKNGNFMYFLHDTVNSNSSLYTLEENQFFLNIVYFHTGDNNVGRFGLSQGDRSRNTTCFQSDSAITAGAQYINLDEKVAAQIGFMSNQGIYLLNDYIVLRQSENTNIYTATQNIANKLASLLADSYILSTSNGTIDINTLLEFIHYNYKTLYTQDLIFNASVKSDNNTLNIHGLIYSQYLDKVRTNSSTTLKNNDVNVHIQYNSITKNIPIQLEVNSIAPIQYNNSSYIWKSVSDNSDVAISNVGYNQIYYISQDKQLLPIGDNQVFSIFEFTSNSEATRTEYRDLAQLYSAFSYKNGLQITPSSATYCQVGGDVKGETLDLPVLRELPLDSKIFESIDSEFLHAKF